MQRWSAVVAGSLLTWSVTGDAVIMHRLLGRVLRERDQADGQWASTVTAALDLLEPRFFPEEQAWARREEGAHLVAQVEALWEACAETGTGDAETSAVRQLRARSWAVRQLQAAADLSRAIDLGARTLADSERVLGADHPRHPHLAEQPRRRLPVGGPAGAGDPAVRAGRWPTASGCWAPTTRTPSPRGRNLAYAYQSAGRLEQAIPLYEQTLADCERVLGADHPDTARLAEQPRPRLPVGGPLEQAIPLFEQDAGRPRAGAGRRPPRHPHLAEQPRRRLRVGGPTGAGDPAVRADPRRPRAGAGRRPPRHPHLAEQPRGRLRVGGPAGGGDPAVRADPRRPRAGAGRRPPGHPHLAEQPRPRLPVGGPAGAGDPAVRADARRPRAGAGRRPPATPSPRGTTSPTPTSRRAGWRRRSRCSSAPSPTASGCWAPTTRTPSPRGTTSPAPTSRRAGWIRRSRCSSGRSPTASGCWAPTTPTPSPRGTTSPSPTGRRAGWSEAIPLFERTLADCERVLGADHPDIPHLAEQPRRRLPVGGSAGAGDPAVRADPRRL